MLRALPLALPLLAQAPPAPEAKPAPALLLRGGTIHTMRPGDEPFVGDLRIEAGRIRALGPEASADGATVLDVSGKHLVPGLVDALVNFDPAHDALYLAAGVTLVRDMGGDHFALNLERAPERRDRVPGPALLTAGAALDGDPPAAASAVVLRTPDSAAAYLPILFQENVDFLAILPGLAPDVWRKVLALAHEEELTVFGPRPARVSLAEALAAGQDGFQALDSLLPPGVFWDAVTADDLSAAVAALAQSGKTLVPLLHASALRLDDQAEAPVRQTLGLLAPSYEAWWQAELAARRPFLAEEHRKAGRLVVEQQARALRLLFEAGARIVPGSGAPQPWCLPGTSLHQELQLWVRAGIPPHEVLARATRGAAEALGLAGERGTLAPDAWADVLVLASDPRADLEALLEPEQVVVRGRPIARADVQARLQALGSQQAELRTELARPVAVEPPPQAEEGAVILEGTVESRTFGLRLATERYRVVRLDGGALLFTTRIVHAPAPGRPARELTLEQFVRDGRLVQVHATLKEGGSLLEHDGLWTANTWRMQSRLDGRVVSTPPPFREQPACVEAGSATTMLALAQLPDAEELPVVQLHPGFDAEPVNWRTQRGDDGFHRVRTHVGYVGFRLDAKGALESAVTKVGTGVVEMHALSSDAFGGAGLPPPEAPAGAAPQSPAGDSGSDGG